jgi:hypothetical protein
MSKIVVGGKTYTVPGPTKPIPPGLEDCFGRLRDMDDHGCRNCRVNDFCGQVMEIVILENNLKHDKKTVA